MGRYDIATIETVNLISSTVSWMATILGRVFDNIKFNYASKGQALRME